MQGWTRVSLTPRTVCAPMPEDPVAVVEPVQVMGVEAVAEIGPMRTGTGPGCASQARRAMERAAVGVLPGRLVPCCSSAGGHLARLEDHVLAVVELPVAGEDAPLALQPLVQGRAGEGGDDGEARQVDVRLDGEARGLQEDVRRVVVQAEDEAALEGDAVPVQALDQLAVVARRVEALLRLAAGSRGTIDSNPISRPRQPLRGGQRQQRRIVGRGAWWRGRTTAPSAGSAPRTGAAA